MAVASLTELPVEVLIQVASYLPPGAWLDAFSQASKKCHGAAKIFKFRKIVIFVTIREKLIEDLQRWVRVLEQTSSFRYVRQLKFTHSTGSSLKRFDHMSWSETKKGYYDQMLDNDDEHEDLGGKAVASSPSEIERNDMYYPFLSRDLPYFRSDSYTVEEFWEPAVRFIQELPSLSDLIYACIDPFASGLLQVVHKHQPRCRIHVRSLTPENLILPTMGGRPRSIASDESLLQSSNLCSVLGVCDWYLVDRSIRMDFWKLVDHVQKLSGLQRATVVLFPEPWRWSLYATEPPLRKMFMLMLTTTRGRLTELEISDSWLKYLPPDAELADLTTLRLNSLDDQGRLQKLGGLKAPRLETLHLNLSNSANVEYGSLIKHWTKQQPPLTNLYLTGRIQCLGGLDILSRHGQSLRKLCLRLSEETQRDVYNHHDEENADFALSATQIRLLGDMCPNITDLQIPTLRMKGNKDEVEVYRALGAFGSLEHISLDLTISYNHIQEDHYPPPLHPSLHEYCQREETVLNSPYEGKRYKGQFINAMINHAIDKDLARSIFGVISRARAVVRTRRAVQSLKISANLSHGGNMPAGSDAVSSNICAFLSRKFVCWANTTAQDGALVEEIGLKQRKQLLKHPFYQKPYLQDLLRPCDEIAIHDEMFWKIWPRVTGDWRQDWHSFPLDLS